MKSRRPACHSSRDPKGSRILIVSSATLDVDEGQWGFRVKTTRSSFASASANGPLPTSSASVRHSAPSSSNLCRGHGKNGSCAKRYGMCATGSGKRSSSVKSSTARASTSYRRCAVGTSSSRIAVYVSAKSAAPRGSPSLQRRSSRSWNTYVHPSADTATRSARSGTTSRPRSRRSSPRKKFGANAHAMMS